jgi:hypothetical protein
MASNTDTASAAAAAIVDRLERRLASSRRELEGVAKERKAVAYKALGLDDAVAVRQLATLVKDETAAREAVRNLELAIEVGKERLAAAKAAELAERRPRYRAQDGGEFISFEWPRRGADPINRPAELVFAYFEANKNHPQLPPTPWHTPSENLYLPELPPFTPRIRAPWRDPREARWSGDRSLALDALLAAKPVQQPPAAPRPAGSRRRVTL